MDIRVSDENGNHDVLSDSKHLADDKNTGNRRCGTDDNSGRPPGTRESSEGPGQAVGKSSIDGPNVVKSTVQQESVSLYHKPSGRVIDVDLRPGRLQMSVFVKHREQLIDYSLSDRFREGVARFQKREDKTGDDVDDAKVKSIDDLMWREIVPGYNSQLPDLYLKLSKVRLTGLTFVFFCFLSSCSYGCCFWLRLLIKF